MSSHCHTTGCMHVDLVLSASACTPSTPPVCQWDRMEGCGAGPGRRLAWDVAIDIRVVTLQLLGHRLLQQLLRFGAAFPNFKPVTFLLGMTA